MTSRFVAVAADGETVTAVLRMSSGDALLNAPPGGSVVAISGDTGALINAGAVKLVSGSFVDAATGDPVASLSSLSVIVIE